MPRSKTFLPDVNVWLAVASKRHVHNPPAMEWFGGIAEDQAAFCRVTQMGLLRLLTNRHVMGADVSSQVGAWHLYHELRRDSRVQYAPEPAGIEEVWEELTHKSQPATNLWTDAYLQAFAQLKELRVVSFDRGFRRFGEPEALVLETG